jgi:hypothetical protein
MSFSIADLFKVVLLLLNAMAILSERRLLDRVGLASSPTDLNQVQTPAKEGVAQVLRSVRTLLRGPLIILNAVTIIFTMIFG